MRKRSERIGLVGLEIDCLESLDETIDALFEHLSLRGEPELLDELCPYFGTVWPSARALAEELVSEELEGKTLLELGCGLAVPSLIAARQGANVTATDSHPDIAAFLERNLQLNSVQLRYLSFDWAHESSNLGAFDWVVASDVLYERHQPRIVASAIDRHLLPGGSAILTDPGRPYLQEFADEMKNRGYQPRLQARSVSDASTAELASAARSTREIFVLRFSRQVPVPVANTGR